MVAIVVKAAVDIKRCKEPLASRRKLLRRDNDGSPLPLRALMGLLQSKIIGRF